MVNPILSKMYNLNVQIKLENNKAKLIYDPELVDMEFKRQIKENKTEILKRMRENKAARKIGFLIYNFGELYEYRYGVNAYVFIDRQADGKATAWRESYLPNQNKAIRTKIIADNVPFLKAFNEALGFIRWLETNNKGSKAFIAL